jgi:hypothetical protein
VGQCWLCHEPIGGVNLAQPTLAAEPAGEPGTGRGLVLWWVLLGILVLVCVGLIDEAPGLGIALAVLATPVMIRLLVVMLRRRGQGRPMSVGQVAGALAVSLGVVVAVGVAAALAFGATCATVGLGAYGLGFYGDSQSLEFFIAIIVCWNGISALVGAWVAYGVYRRLRHRR